MISDIVRHIQDNCEDKSMEGIVNFLMQEGLINEINCVRIKIRFHYKKLLRFHNSVIAKEMLSDMYCISYRSVERYLYGK